jgi:hypothetical protein
MSPQSASPFDSIESAHDFVTLLAEAVAEAKREVDADVGRESNEKSSRRLEAFRIASYSLERLEVHMTRSRRILNDLRSLRRLLFQERESARAPARLQAPQTPSVTLPVSAAPVPIAPPPGSNGKSETVLAA